MNKLIKTEKELNKIPKIHPLKIGGETIILPDWAKNIDMNIDMSKAIHRNPRIPRKRFFPPEYNTVAIIPARWDSSRYPGKPLASICGKTMIQRVYEQAKKAKIFDRILIGTDSERIATECQRFIDKDDEIIISDTEYESGSDRLADIVRLYKLDDYDTIVNIQGDNPIIDPEYLKAIALGTHLDGNMYTLACEITDRKTLFDENAVKVVIDKHKNALYFSRSCIPGGDLTSMTETEINFIPRLKHIGIYAYKAWFLKKFKSWPKSHLENIEKLEQLRILENRERIKVLIVKEDCPDVNSPWDVRKVEKIILDKKLDLG